MKATELIEKLQNMVNQHGDFDLKIGYTDDEYSYNEYLQPEEFDVFVNWDDRDNDWNGGWIYFSRIYENDED